MKSPALMDERNCADADTELFFPSHKDIAAARRVIATYCKPCPVRRECLDFAMEIEGASGSSGRSGIYGGTIPSTRAKIHAASIKAVS